MAQSRIGDGLYGIDGCPSLTQGCFVAGLELIIVEFLKLGQQLLNSCWCKNGSGYLNHERPDQFYELVNSRLIVWCF